MRLSFFLLVASCGGAQIPQGENTVSGTVQNSVTGQPIPNAVVYLDSPRGSDHSPGKATRSGAAGEFRLSGIPNGSYIVRAIRPEFADDTDIKLELPQPKVSAISVPLTPLGIIETTVRNQYGEPLERVLIDILELRIKDGRRTLRSVAKFHTDDQGRCTVTRISPGNYYVRVAGKPDGTYLHSGAERLIYDSWETFLPEYLGGVRDIADATTVAVAVGQRVRADFVLAVQPARRIRGKLSGYTGSEPVNFELHHDNGPTEPNRAWLNRFTGQFEILDVLPGEYRLRVSQGRSRDEVAVKVGDGDLRGVTLALAPPTEIEVIEIRAAGSEINRPPAAFVNEGCWVNLYEPWSADAFGGDRTYPGHASFRIEELYPGDYHVGIHCAGGYPVSATYGEVDLLTHPSLVVSARVSPPQIVIQFRPGGGTLRVRLTEAAPVGAGVLLVPALRPTRPLILEDAFEHQNLIPGDYSVYALARLIDAEYFNPAFLASLQGGTQVHIEEGKTTEILLRSFSK
jgi:hypothetical protein